jgi:hypothetical protein
VRLRVAKKGILPAMPTLSACSMLGLGQTHLPCSCQRSGATKQMITLGLRAREERLMRRLLVAWQMRSPHSSRGGQQHTQQPAWPMAGAI